MTSEALTKFLLGLEALTGEGFFLNFLLPFITINNCLYNSNKNFFFFEKHFIMGQLKSNYGLKIVLAPLSIQIEVLDHGNGLDLPEHATKGSAGLDLRAAIQEPVTLSSGDRYLFPCGFKLALPTGYEAQLRPRSGLALNHGITVLNTPGTVDSDYRGEIKVLLINHGQEPFVVERGMRIAQMIISPYATAYLVAVDHFNENLANERHAFGFGSTGLL